MSTLQTVILALGLSIAALVHGGIYTISAIATTVGGTGAYRLNRFTGDLVYCNPSGCSTPLK